VSGGAAKGPHCPIAKESRFPADRPRLPCAGLSPHPHSPQRPFTCYPLSPLSHSRQRTIAYQSRFPADRPRLPWRGRFAFRAERAFLGRRLCAGGPSPVIHSALFPTAASAQSPTKKGPLCPKSKASAPGPHCPIAKESRFPADRPRLPWRGRFAFRAERAFLGPSPPLPLMLYNLVRSPKKNGRPGFP
jgi:hypothetical protein